MGETSPDRFKVTAIDWSTADRSVYDQGYRDGESNVSGDWQIALGDLVPDDVDPAAPSQVAAYIERLQAAATKPA